MTRSPAALRPLAAASAAVLAAVLIVPGTPATASRTDAVTVDGVADVIIVDTFDEDSTLPRTLVSVDVDGVSVPVPQDEAEELEGGETVELTIDAPAGMSTDEAVVAAATGDEAVRLTALEVVEAAPALDPDLQAASAAGAHTITVLPVYWDGKPADTTVAQLTTMANESAAYWADTSEGEMTFTTPVVRSFVKLPTVPASCNDVEGLYRAALTAHGVSNPSGTPNNRTHVVVYFPEWDSCGGWLGLASTTNGKIWVNGFPTAEVLAHEMGHNLGLGHANAKVCYTSTTGAQEGRVPVLIENPGTLADGWCRTQEYGDFADLMGNVWEMAPGSLNSALANEIGFADIANVPSVGMTQVSLKPLWDESGVRTIRIPNAPHRSFWVDYRPAADRDTRQPSWAGVQVHERNIDRGVPVSYLLGMDPANSRVPMPVGSRYTFPAGTDGRWTIQLLSVGATATLLVTPPAGFADVAPSHPFYADIAWMRHTYVSTGWTTSTGLVYRPSQAVTREAMAAFLYRAAGSPEFTPPAVSPFVDVSTGHPFYKAIAWMAASGISTGTTTASGAYYKPGDPVSRDAMAAFLYRAAGSPAFTPPAASPFVDVSTGHPFYAAIAWMKTSGVSTGTVTASGAYYKPADAVSREAMAAFIYRFYNL